MRLEEIRRDDAHWDALWTLFGAYLHQDFPDVHGDPWNAVTSFCAEGPASTILDAADQVHEVLGMAESEDQAAKAVDLLGADYYPPADGWTYRGWLAELERFLRSEHERRTRSGP